MIIYELSCLNEDGAIESNGFYQDLEDAKIAKVVTDDFPMNKRYSIEQNIIEHELYEKSETPEAAMIRNTKEVSIKDITKEDSVFIYNHGKTN